MTDKELKRILNFIEKTSNEKEKNEVTQIILRAASESITLERLQRIASFKEEKKTEEDGQRGFIKFTKKEIEKMPDRLKKMFAVNDKIVSYRIYHGAYQARYRRDGYKIEVSGRTFEIMKTRFIEKLLLTEREHTNQAFPLFKEAIDHWLVVKEKLVKASTFKGYRQSVNCYLLPKFGEHYVNEMTRHDIQIFLFGYVDAGKARTAQKLKIILKEVFDMLNEDYDLKSPMKKIVLAHHEPKKGKAFRKFEEREIVDFCALNPHYYGNSALLLLMYTGMRVGELASMWKDDKFIYCLSEKIRKGYPQVIRRIPISPMLKRVLPLIDFELAKK